jgi:arylformamidase
MAQDFNFNADSAYLDGQYNNRLRVPHFMEHVLQWQADSKQVRQSAPCHLDVAYGNAPSEKLDIFHPQSKNAPVVIFIHGGYWRSLDKADHSFVAPAFTGEGACVVVPNYALAPSVTMEQLVMQLVQSVAWVYSNIARYGGDPSRMTVIGHSAGGHLAAMMLACIWPKVARDLPKQVVRNALSLSGLHDLAPIMHSPYLQGDLRLTAAQVKRCSPAYFPAPAGELVALCGGDESDEFLRQNALIEQAWGKRCVIACETAPGCHHFSVLEALCTPGTRAHALAMQLVRK